MDDPSPAGGAVDIKSNDIIEISVPNNPKIDTHNDISVISLNFLMLRRAAGNPLLAGGAADFISNGIIEISGTNKP